MMLLVLSGVEWGMFFLLPTLLAQYALLSGQWVACPDPRFKDMRGACAYWERRARAVQARVSKSGARAPYAGEGR